MSCLVIGYVASISILALSDWPQLMPATNISTKSPGGFRVVVFNESFLGELEVINRVLSERDVSAVAKDEKAKAKVEQAKGKVKEAAGRAVGNEGVTGKGRAEKAKGDVRQAKEKTKDAFKH